MRVLERLARETGREYALRVLKENIVGLDLLPGSMLSENEIASCLNLSRTPVRDAFIELSKVKIVEIYPQKGSVVSLIDYNMVEEARFMRYVLESAVVELVCQKITPDWIRKLEENVTLQQFHLDNHRPERLLELDNEFHQMLFEIAEKTQVFVLMESISIHYDRVRSLALKAIKDIKTVDDHRMILKAVSEGNAEEAKRLMEKHLNRYKVDRETMESAYPQYFKA